MSLVDEALARARENDVTVTSPRIHALAQRLVQAMIEEAQGELQSDCAEAATRAAAHLAVCCSRPGYGAGMLRVQAVMMERLADVVDRGGALLQ